MTNWLCRISPCLRLVGEKASAPNWLEAMRVIYEHELVLFAGNDYLVEIGGEAYACPRGSFIIVPPGSRHVSREVGGGRGHRRWLHFDWSYAGEHVGRPLETYAPASPKAECFRSAPEFVPREILHGEIQREEVVLELFARISRLWNQGSGRERLAARGLLLELLLELLCPEIDERPATDASTRLASKTRAALNKLAALPVREAPPIQEYLERTGPGYAHQCRIFKQHYGLAPLRYVNESRMTRIKNLLRDTDQPISAIAEMLGYDNLGYFSRVFRKHVGLAPRDYRQGPRS
jgi:AraC-like DNA-binding protein